MQREHALGEREAALARGQEELAQHQALLAKTQEELARHKAVLAQKQEELARREAVLAQQARAQDEKDAALARAREELAQRVRVLAQQARAQDEKAAALLRAQADLARREGVLAQQTAVLHAERARLDALLSPLAHAASPHGAGTGAAMADTPSPGPGRAPWAANTPCSRALFAQDYGSGGNDNGMSPGSFDFDMDESPDRSRNTATGLWGAAAATGADVRGTTQPGQYTSEDEEREVLPPFSERLQDLR